MVIFPIAEERNSVSLAAWPAVEERQRQSASSYWLVTQPAHAALSGELAASLREDLFGAIDDTVARFDRATRFRLEHGRRPTDPAASRQSEAKTEEFS